MEEIKCAALIFDAGAKHAGNPDLASTLRAMRNEAVRLVAATSHERGAEYAVLAFEVLALPMEEVT